MKKTAPKKVTSVKRGGEVGEQDAVSMFRDTALNSLKQGRAISVEERYYVENPKQKFAQSKENINQYFATKKSGPASAGKAAQQMKKDAAKKIKKK
jgi:hypothetical protein